MFTKTNTIRQLVEDVKSYAVQNYGKGGWDYVVETMDDWDIAEIVKGANTPKGAIWKMSVHLGPIAGYRDEVRASAEW